MQQLVGTVIYAHIIKQFVGNSMKRCMDKITFLYENVRFVHKRVNICQRRRGLGGRAARPARPAPPAPPVGLVSRVGVLRVIPDRTGMPMARRIHRSPARRD